MASYLLLRDNKESGPFTMDDLLHSGLKPYDLIWVQGKSAAWRYPSEIEELKPFAPAVEEQPFDRFYKKATEEEKKEDLPVKNEHPPVIDKQFERYIPASKQQDEPAFVPKKSVFVTLPGQKQQPVSKEMQQPARREPQPVKDPTPPVSTPTISITENPAAAEIKYSQPLDEIKEMYVKTLLERKDKKVKKGLFVNSLKKVAVFGGLVVLGLAAGFIIRSKPGDSKSENKTVQELLEASPTSLVNSNNISEPQQDEPIQNSSSVTVSTPVENKNEPINDAATGKAELSNFDEEPAPIKIRKETMLIVPKRKEDYDRQTTPGVEINSLTGERERKLRKIDEEDEMVTRSSNKNSLKDLVSVASNDYKRVAFGGIRNLYLTVTNHSKYELDNVIVELQYLKPSEEPLRIENIKFKSIAPNTSSTIRVPDTNRGIKVSYKIINIDSRQNSGVAPGL